MLQAGSLYQSAPGILSKSVASTVRSGRQASQSLSFETVIAVVPQPAPVKPPAAPHSRGKPKIYLPRQSQLLPASAAVLRHVPGEYIYALEWWLFFILCRERNQDSWQAWANVLELEMIMLRFPMPYGKLDRGMTQTTAAYYKNLSQLKCTFDSAEKLFSKLCFSLKPIETYFLKTLWLPVFELKKYT